MKTRELINRMREEVEKGEGRSAWWRGVKAYASDPLDDLEEMIDDGYEEQDVICSPKLLERALLNGASDWKQYSEGGCSLCYDGQIAERLCNPSELKKFKGGQLGPNSRENWIDVQSRGALPSLHAGEVRRRDCEERDGR